MGVVRRKRKLNRRLRGRSRLFFYFTIFVLLLWYSACGIIRSMENFRLFLNKYKSPNVNGESIGEFPKNSEKPRQTDWQKVAGSQDKFLVYSAYYVQNLTQVKVIGATKRETQERVQCRLYDNYTRYYRTVDGSIQITREHWNLTYSACFVICHLRNIWISPERNLVPKYVSFMATVKSSSTTPPSNIIRVQYPEEKTAEYSVEFSVCVKPIHFDYNNITRFLEWMEFHGTMGVKKFAFYNHTIAPGVSCLMEELYGDSVPVLPSTLPYISQKEIMMEGLFAALNDCVYRHRGASKYLILVDLDEMIVPRRAQNYSQLVSQLTTLKEKSDGNGTRTGTGAYSIQNAFFYLQWPDDHHLTLNFSDDPLARDISGQLLMMRKTRRRADLYPHRTRSKYICMPEKVMEAGNHSIWEMFPGYSTK